MASSTPDAASDWYQPLDADLVRQQLESFQQLEFQIQQEWEDESLKYEQQITVTLKQGKKMVEQQVPRRNYANPEGTVQDPSLYPYDTALYPLLDAYDSLYLADTPPNSAAHGSPLKQPIPKDSIPPCTLPVGRRTFAGLVDEDMYDEGDIPVVDAHTPVSIQCLGQTLLQKRFHCCGHETLVYLMQQALDNNQEFFNNPLECMKAQAALHGDNAFYSAAAQGELMEPNEVSWISEKFGHEQLPFTRTHRGGILLKVLKHTLSELQRDDRLAATVSILLARHHDLDDTSLLARFLAIMASEYITCDGECYWDDPHLATHYCTERQNLDAFIPQILAFGVTVLRNEHANVLAGFVRYTFHREFGHMFDMEEDAAGMNEKRNRLIKRTAFTRRMEGEDDDVEGGSNVPVDLISSVIHGLGVRGSHERHRLKAVQQDSNAATESIALALETYINCLRALVDIAEACLLYLPPVERFYTLASAVVKTIASLLIDSTEPLVKPVAEDELDDDESEQDDLYFASRDAALTETRLCVPTRLADCITNATAMLHRLEQPKVSDSASIREQLFCKIRQVCYGRPPNHVRDAVRSLFFREMVDVREAFLGYSDFLVWCRFPYDITPLDPVIVAYGTNFPCEEDSDSDDSDSDDEDDDSDDESSASGEARIMNWETDEDDHVLTRGELRARFDFSLLLLFRVWYAPWNPKSHLSFQPQFRQAAKSVMMCTHHLSMPRDVGLRIVEFLGRDFWPDDRSKCWSFECPETAKNIAKHASGNQQATTSIKSVVTCHSCKIANYCCETCRKTDWKEDHKRFCGAPPFRPVGADEQRFIASVLDEEVDTRQEHVAAAVNGDEMDVDNNVVGGEAEDEDWSDIESDSGDDGGAQSRTQQIYRYFQDRSYSSRGIDD